MDRLQGPFAPLYRDTKVFSLRLLGRRTDSGTAALAAAALALAAAVSEELLFRGLIFSHVDFSYGAKWNELSISLIEQPFHI